MTNTQVYSHISEAEEHSHTYPRLCLVHGDLSSEEPPAAGLHDHYKPECWVVCRSVPCKAELQFKNKTEHTIHTFCLYTL